jgi:quercetin dioxygenase-like cupin family protein
MVGPKINPIRPIHTLTSIFLVDGQQTRLGPGDMYLVPSGKPHSIQQLTEHIRLVDCFTPIREDFL